MSRHRHYSLSPAEQELRKHQQEKHARKKISRAKHKANQVTPAATEGITVAQLVARNFRATLGMGWPVLRWKTGDPIRPRVSSWY